MLKRKGFWTRFIYKPSEDILSSRYFSSSGVDEVFYKKLIHWDELIDRSPRKFLLLEELLESKKSFTYGTSWVWCFDFFGEKFFLLYDGEKIRIESKSSSEHIDTVLNIIYNRIVWTLKKRRYKIHQDHFRQQ